MSAREHSQHTVIVIPGRVHLPATKAKARSALKWRLAVSEQLAIGACCCLWRNSRSHRGERKAGSCGRLRGDDSILGTSSHLTAPCGRSSGAPVPTVGRGGSLPLPSGWHRIVCHSLSPQDTPHSREHTVQVRTGQVLCSHQLLSAWDPGTL